MKLSPLLLISIFCAVITPVASAQEYDPVCEDPVSTDTLFPAQINAVDIVSWGFKMSGILYVAQGRGPHPTVILLHGFPGYEQDLDLAQAIRRSGWNALIFHYRGAWGSEGTFSFANVLEDVAAAIAFVKGPAGDSSRCSRDQIVLIGHSMGGWAALMAAAKDSSILAVASIACWNIGRDSRKLVDSAAFAVEVKYLEGYFWPLRWTSAEALTRERVIHLEEWDLVNHLTPLVHRPVLLIAASGDGAQAIADSHTLLLSGLEAAEAEKVTSTILKADHAVSNKRIALAREVISWLRTLGER